MGNIYKARLLHTETKYDGCFKEKYLAAAGAASWTKEQMADRQAKQSRHG